MAKTYYYCDGETKKSTSVSMTESGVYTRTYTMGDFTEVIETYKNLTFTFSPTVVYTSTGNFSSLFRIKYIYDFRASNNGTTFDAWQSTSDYVIIPSNTTTKEVEVLMSRTYCETSSGGQW